ncbi:MAG TPA: NADH-quinone oxidoreductase subunit J, partial [Desulfobacterales bacterium]|nr:NADH-quinone oxidoreductase subunit J [Desulfobacterales bacterium]
ALFLLVNFCTLAGLYILLNAQFVAIAQVIVYAGAVVVLFLFAVMLLGESEAEGPETQPRQQILTFILAAALIVEVGAVLAGGVLGGVRGPYTQELVARIGNTQAVGEWMFKKYVLPFELASVLLLAAIVGAVALARRKL